MKTAKASIALLLVLAFATWGCEHAGPIEAIDAGNGEVTLSQIQASILDTKCAVPSCHVSGAAFADLVLSDGDSYGSMVGVASDLEPGVLRVKPGDPDSSYVVWKVEGDPRIIGLQMPRGGTPLSASDIAAIRNWIANGAKNN